MVEAQRYMKEVCEGEYVRGNTFMLEETWVPSRGLAFNNYNGNFYVYRQVKSCRGQPAIYHLPTPLNMHKLDVEDRQALLDDLRNEELTYNKRVEELSAQYTVSYITLDVDYVTKLETMLTLKEQLQTSKVSEASDNSLDGNVSDSDSDSDEDDIYSKYGVDHVSVLQNSVFVTVMPDEAVKVTIEDNTGLIQPNYILIN